MSIRTFLFICCAAVMVSTANAENPVKPETPETPNHPTHKLMDKRVSELMADRVGFKKDMALKELAEINEKAELEARAKKYKTTLYPGFYFGYCLTTIFTFRFLVEFIKASQEAFEDSMMLLMGQWLHIPGELWGAHFMYHSFKPVK